MMSHRIEQPSASESGTSLVELMIGIVVIITVLVSLVTLTTQQARLRKHDSELYLAYLAARNTMEEIRALPFSTIAALHGADFDAPDLLGNPGGLKAVAGDLDGLPGEISVVVDQAIGGETMYMATVSVVWTGAMARSEYSMKSLVSERKKQ